MNRGFRGGPGFARPENALKRSEELENVGQKNSALQVLHDIVTNKRHRTWSKTYEQIMFKHIDLVVEMKKRNYAKEALMQYRNMCQAVNINSLEEVIKYFLQKASEKAEEAQSKAAAVTIDVEDLEEDTSPEDIMLSYVSGDKSKDRTDRELVTPWFRFLWEAYRSVLEILRTNPKLEPLYAMTANKAFQFCLQFKRTTEFRRLSDILRQHLTNLTNRYRENRESTPDQLQPHLETRFEQLKVACELEMWAEAFRSVEDIQALILLAKKTPKQQLMATYYARLTQIFAVSENHLYHAYAWLKMFNFSKSCNKNLTQGDVQGMTSSVLLATLSILPYEQRALLGGSDDSASEQEKERIVRMANILGFAVDSKRDYRTLLSRAALLTSVASPAILSQVLPEVRAIYDLLTQDFSPLELCARLGPLVEKLGEVAPAMSPASPVKDANLGMYVNSLKQVALLRLLKQLSEVYSTMRVSSLAELVSFMSLGEVEAVVMDAVKNDYLQVRIDHRNGTLHFGSQQVESDHVRNHLSALTHRLSKAVHMMHPADSAEHAEARAAAIKTALETMDREHTMNSGRKIMIEKRKEESELAMLEAEKEEERRRVAAAREAEAAEEKRRREEALRRETERIQRELEERDQEEARALLEANKKKLGAKGGKLEASGLDKRTLVAEVLTERMKEAQEMERRMHKLAKQLDHLERARREEEAPLLNQLSATRLEEARKQHGEQQTLDLARHRSQWESDLEDKKRLSVTLGDTEAFKAQIMARREEEFEELSRLREEAYKQRLEEKRRQRHAQRIQAFAKRCMEAVRERMDEIEEEEMRKEQERKAAEDAEVQRKVREEAEREQRRLAEADVKAKEEGPAPAAGGKFVPSAARRQDGPSAPPPGDDWRGSRDDDRWGRREAPPPARGGDDRWGRRDDGPPAAGRYAPPVRRDDGPPAARPAEAPRPAAPASSGGKFVPPHLRNRQ